MNGAKFTDRANKALLDASSLAEQYAHSQILPVHLAVALLDPPADESVDQQVQYHASHSASAAPLFKQVVERAHGDPQLLDRALKKPSCDCQSRGHAGIFWGRVLARQSHEGFFESTI